MVVRLLESDVLMKTVIAIKSIVGIEAKVYSFSVKSE